MTETSAAFTRSQRIRIAIVAGVIPVAVIVTNIVILASWYPELPDPIAIHWGVGGEPNGYGPLAALLFLIGGVVVIFSTTITITLIRLKAPARAGLTARTMVATSVFLSFFLSYGVGGTVAIQRGLETAADAGSVAGILTSAAMIAISAAIVAWLISPKPRILDAAADRQAPALPLAPDERVLWQRTVGPSRTAVLVLGAATLLVAGAMVLVATVGTVENAPLLVIPLVIVIAAAVSLSWSVRIDNSGLILRGIAGVPRLRYPIAAIEQAQPIAVNAFGEFGGFGIRWGGKGRTGIILRTGEALEVTLAGKRSVVVTVDDASTAASLINGLIARRASAKLDPGH